MASLYRWTLRTLMAEQPLFGHMCPSNSLHTLCMAELSCFTKRALLSAFTRLSVMQCLQCQELINLDMNCKMRLDSKPMLTGLAIVFVGNPGKECFALLHHMAYT